jgi:predicted Fe-Mo cluster-binding NifX family protein
MNIVFTAQGKEWASKMDARFGRAQFFVVYNEEEETLKSLDNSDVENEAHGAGPKAAQKMAEAKANVIITGNGPGGNAATVLEKLGVKCYIGAGDMSIEEAYNAFKEGNLKEF